MHIGLTALGHFKASLTFIRFTCVYILISGKTFLKATDLHLFRKTPYSATRRIPHFNDGIVLHSQGFRNYLP